MFLDDQTLYAALDPAAMHAELVNLPAQFESAWAGALQRPLPAWTGIDRVVVAGMGGSAIGAELASAWLEPDARVPLAVHRDYGLPGWAQGGSTLVVVSSHSGNTEETLSAYAEAVRRGCRVLAISTGGELQRRALADGQAFWGFEHAGQPRAGVGFSFGLLLAALARSGLAPDPSGAVASAAAAMRAQLPELIRETPTVHNPAKRYAGQLMGRSVVILGAEFLAPVARRWKTQINELAKAWAACDAVPEANHNALEGMTPEAISSGTFSMFLVSSLYGERNALRMELTRRSYMLNGISTDFYAARGEGRMAHLWTALQFGDFVAYYLAIAYGVDPTPVEALQAFKQELTRK